MYNSKAFQEGWKSWDAYFFSNWSSNKENPYLKYSENWILWNRGWNINFKGIK